MSLMDIVSWLIFLGLVFWKFHWLVWGTTAVLFFGCGRYLIEDAIKQDLEPPCVRIGNVFWGILFIYVALRLILALYLGEHISFDLAP